MQIDRTAKQKIKNRSIFSYVWLGSLVLTLAVLIVFSRFDRESTQKQTSFVADLEKMSLKDKSKLSQQEWANYLTPEQFNVLKEDGTEAPFTGALLHEKRVGTYVTADCGIPVFRSETKYDSKTGWPSFYAPIENSSLELVKDTTLGYERVEVREKTCGSHLGHIFDDGPAPTGDRYCINAVALRFIPDKKTE